MTRGGCSSPQFERVRANLYLHAILPVLEEVSRRDKFGAGIASESSGALQFHVLQGPSAYVIFRGGWVDVFSGRLKRPDVGLTFADCRSLHRAFAKQGIPWVLPWRGIFRKDLRGAFENLAGRAEYLLKTPRDRLGDSLSLAAELLLYVAVYSTKVIAEQDPVGRQLLMELPEGVAEFRIGEDGPAANLRKQGGCIFAGKGGGQDPDVRLLFSSFEVAHDFLNNRLDGMAAIGARRIQLQGMVPFAEGLGELMERSVQYLE